MALIIWKTGHEISDTICEALYKILPSELFDVRYDLIHFNPDDVHIAYGILRGTSDIFKCAKHWFEIDKGFWGANHYDGNYRIAYKGTQCKYRPLATQGKWQFQDWKIHGDTILIVPPTLYVCHFFNIDLTDWLSTAIKECGNTPHIIRMKGSGEKIDWEKIKGIITYNSTLGFEALARGVPVISDIENSLIGNYYGKNSIDYTLEDVISVERGPLFDCADMHQFKLTDSGQHLWNLINSYCQFI